MAIYYSEAKRTPAATLKEDGTTILWDEVEYLRNDALGICVRIGKVASISSALRREVFAAITLETQAFNVKQQTHSNRVILYGTHVKSKKEAKEILSGFKAD